MNGGGRFGTRSEISWSRVSLGDGSEGTQKADLLSRRWSEVRKVYRRRERGLWKVAGDKGRNRQSPRAQRTASLARAFYEHSTPRDASLSPNFFRSRFSCLRKKKSQFPFRKNVDRSRKRRTHPFLAETRKSLPHGNLSVGSLSSSLISPRERREMKRSSCSSTLSSPSSREGERSPRYATTIVARSLVAYLQPRLARSSSSSSSLLPFPSPRPPLLPRCWCTGR